MTLTLRFERLVMTPHKKLKALKREKAKRLLPDAVSLNFPDFDSARFPAVFTNVTDSETFDALYIPMIAALKARVA